MDDRTTTRNAVRDPIPDALADSVWLGGEAMVAPYAQLGLPAVERDGEFADPDWRVL
jgi:hypothetical protein